MIDGHEDHLFNAHIQELKPDNATAVIFVEELGEKLVVDHLVHFFSEPVSCAVCREVNLITDNLIYNILMTAAIGMFYEWLEYRAIYIFCVSL